VGTNLVEVPVKSRIFVALILPAAVWAAVSAAGPNPSGQDSKPFGLESPAAGKYSAVTNCSSSNCHGNGSKGNEYSIWAGDDPHRKAYAVLHNDVSARIQKNLKRDTPAFLDSQCLKCHAVNEEKHYHGEVVPGRALSEGVSCDACHGPSQAWLGEHYKADWKQLSDREKFEKYGFKPTKDLVTRALLCAQCHVGARDREVNHDLIAAGHPRLAFEAARYHFTDNYPKHWKERIPNPAFETQLWLIGQAASLRQATDLLAARSEAAATKKKPWPELSEFSCFACHQDVAGSKNRAENGERNGRLPGRTGWQVWYTALGQHEFSELPDVMALHALMSNDFVEPAAAAAAAKRAVTVLDTWLATEQKGGYLRELTIPPEFHVFARDILAHALSDNRQKLRDTDWDFLAQHTLALAAAAHAGGDESKAWRPLVAKLQAALAFPPDTGGKRFDSPKDYDAKAVLELFQALDAQLNRAGADK
jgi:hypothetical protein